MYKSSQGNENKYTEVKKLRKTPEDEKIPPQESKDFSSMKMVILPKPNRFNESQIYTYE